MPQLTAFHLRGVNLLIWQATETLCELEALFEAGASLRKEAQCRFRHERRVREWMLARLMLKKHYGEQCSIDYLPCGKPILKGREGHISISHTGDYLALAFSDDQPIGIDIEQWSPRALRLSEHFLHPEELTTHEAEATALWSAKEAAYKLMGDAYSTVADLHIECVEPRQRYRVTEARHEAVVIERRDFSDFVLTLATFG